MATTGTSTSASLPSYSYNVCQPKRTIRYIRTHVGALLESHASAITLHGSFLGLDIEWRPNWVKRAPEHRVALIQLASRHEVLLFQIHRVGHLPPVLMALLRDPDIKKVGVNIRGDIAKLHKDWNIDVQGAVDLSEVAWEMDAKHWHAARNSAKRFPIGLARLVERYLVLQLDKPKAIQRSDWENVLDERRQIYAANDAAAAYDLQEYFTMVNEGQVQLPPPMEPKVDTESPAMASTSIRARTPTKE